MKKYNKPKFSVIKISVESLLQVNSPGGNGGSGTITDPTNPTPGGGNESLDAKVLSFRIFDDSFEDMSIEETDYTTTTNTVEVW